VSERHQTDDPGAIDAAIVDSYTRTPPDEDFGAAWAARASIEAEPWEDAGGSSLIEVEVVESARRTTRSAPASTVSPRRGSSAASRSAGRRRWPPSSA
jgi:hypothetical protein